MKKFRFIDLKIVTEIPKEMFKRPKLNRYGGPSSAKETVKRNDKDSFEQGFSSGKRRNSAT